MAIEGTDKKIIDTFYSLGPVNWILRMFVLRNVKRRGNKLVQCWSLIENLIVVSVTLAINILNFFTKSKLYNITSIKKDHIFLDTIQLTFILSYIEYILDLGYVFKMRHSYVKHLTFYSNIDKIINAPNFATMRMKYLITVVLFILSFVLSTALDYFSWLVTYGWVEPTLYLLDHGYFFMISLTVLDFISNVMQIEYRLKVIINVLEEYTSSLTKIKQYLDEDFIETHLACKIETVPCNQTHYDMSSLSKFYVLLIEQVNYLNTVYGRRLGGFCLTALIFLTYLTNICMRLILGQFVFRYESFNYPAISTASRIINYAGVLFALVYRCEQTYRRSEDIVRLIDLTVLTDDIPPDVSSELAQLRELVQSRAIRFHAVNFFLLDYPLLVSVVSVVVSYTIIILQSMK